MELFYSKLLLFIATFYCFFGLSLMALTVPSCEKHNNFKSDDDEFLMVSLAGILGNNSIGYIHSRGKVKRANPTKLSYQVKCH